MYAIPFSWCSALLGHPNKIFALQLCIDVTCTLIPVMCVILSCIDTDIDWSLSMCCFQLYSSTVPKIKTTLDSPCRNLARRYDQIHGPSDDNAFWPGHLLTKLRLCMPNANDGKSSIFNPVLPVKRTNVGYHNDLNTWPSDLRCVKYGSIDKWAENQWIAFMLWLVNLPITTFL